MYLKRLEIKGFKSFADQTELNLEPGINIIVGPNGCGKSNIVDAIRWVLGEANVRHLRGHRNEDVIFNGTDKKRALGLAHVEMTVDNLDRNIPLDYAEVTISRKIFRSGESEFYINRTRVRMKDIVKLYMDTGLGKSGYSIISQGELERVLNGQPLDRRLMLEEAAGIIKYRQQRDEVQQRILATSNDLVRAEDIVGELGNREYELQAKAEKARIYLELRERQLFLDKEVTGAQVQENLKQQQQRAEELRMMQADLEIMRSQATSIKEFIIDLEVKSALNTSQWQLLKDERASVETVLSRTEGEIRLTQERIRNNLERIRTAETDTLKYRQLLDKMAVDLVDKYEDLKLQKEKYEARLQDLDQINRDIRELESKTHRLDKSLDDQTRQAFNRANEEAALRNEMSGLETRARQLLEKKERWRFRIEEMETTFAASHIQIGDLQDQKLRLGNQQRELQDTIQREEKLCEQKRAAKVLAEQSHHQAMQEVSVLEHRLQVIDGWQKSYAGYSGGVKAILTNSTAPGWNGIIGVVADLIDIPENIELAITTALGKSYENIVVRTTLDADRAIESLKQKRWGRATFLPLDTMRVTPVPDKLKQEIMAEPGVIGIAADLLGYDQEHAVALEYLLGRVLIVDNLVTGWRLFRKAKYPFRIVTREGDVINISGAVSGGVVNQQANSHPLANKQEITRTKKRLQELKQSAGCCQAEAEQANNDLQHLENELQNARNRLAQVSFKFDMINQEIQRMGASRETLQLDICRLQQESLELEAVIEQSTVTINQLKDQVKNSRTQDVIDDQEMERTKIQLESCRRELAIKQERYHSVEEQLVMKKREIDSLTQNISQFEKVKESYLQSSQEAEGLKRKLTDSVDQQSTEVKQMIFEAEGQNHLVQSLTASIEAISTDVQNLNQKTVKMNDELEPLYTRIETSLERMRLIELRQVRLETELEGLIRQWQDRFDDEDPTKYQVLASPRQIRDYRLQLDEVRDQIEQLGPVDIDAIKEYDDVKARYDFLCRQITDLTAAKVSLQELLEETEKIMARNFAQFICLAEASFQKTFREIFNGGDAGLSFESDGSLSGGVDLTVKMPGKRTQALNLLSGGERALTCIAFIFALLRLKPAPFCLLDEIDASLDETNLIRYTDFLKNMAQDTQFIVVTHRQATIEAGNNIYGITMPEEGISSVFSIRSEQIESMAV